MSQPYDFTILTDSSADLGEDLVREMDIQVLPLSFTIQDKTYHNYPDNRELDPHVFYQMLREGHHRRRERGAVSPGHGGRASGREGRAGGGLLLRPVRHL